MSWPTAHMVVRQERWRGVLCSLMTCFLLVLIIPEVLMCMVYCCCCYCCWRQGTVSGKDVVGSSSNKTYSYLRAYMREISVSIIDS